jgi:hypothetical protein
MSVLPLRLDVEGTRSSDPRPGGERCRILARGRMNSVLIEFEDGERAVVSGNGFKAGREVARSGEAWRN